MWLVVGVSGVTCGGKSSLARALQDAFSGAALVSQDDFFLPTDDPCHVKAPGLNHHNWEILSSLDMDRMVATVKRIISEETDSPRILIIEGFLIFNHEGIRALCNCKYYFTLPRDECWERRSIRTYDPPDPPGYFDNCVWPEYERHRDEVLANVSDVVVIDGRRRLTDTLQLVVSQLKHACNKLLAGNS